MRQLDYFTIYQSSFYPYLQWMATKKKASLSAILYVLVAMLGVFIYYFREIYRVAWRLHFITAAWCGWVMLMPLATILLLIWPAIDSWLGWLLAGLLRQSTHPVYRITFQLDIVKLICLTIAVYWDRIFISMKAVSLVSPLVVSAVSASGSFFSLLPSFFSLVWSGWISSFVYGVIIVPMIFVCRRS